ncbi:MAG: hypothetical protein ABJO02_08910 [Reichenbachiella sp.]|uniref:hypothetical protein n=1 Tax=Reichenbachiella sp. TaxID=2184521 RepID=UPI0032973A8C
MNTHAEKTQENKTQSVANTVSQKKNDNKSTFQFVDNRPEAITQRKLQEMANNSDFPHEVVQLSHQTKGNQSKGKNSKKKAKSANKKKTRTYVLPLENTKDLKPPEKGVSSWLEHHNSKGSPGNWGNCSIEGCDEKASKGAHVAIHSTVNESKVMARRSGKVTGGKGPSTTNRFILPTCSYHNSKKHDGYKLLIKKGSILISPGLSKKKVKT